MLKLPHKYTDDKEADFLIASYLNRNILELVRNEILNYETGRRKEAQKDNPDFCNAVRDFSRALSGCKNGEGISRIESAAGI